MTEGAWLRIDARGVPVQKGTILTPVSYTHLTLPTKA